MSKSEEIFRTRIVRHGVNSSVSMDSLLAKHAASRLGGEVALRQWVQKTVNKILETNTKEQIKAGLSRMVQRKALLLVLNINDTGLDKKNDEQPS
jgi:hypothetical protein